MEAMTAEHIDAVIGAIERHDPELANRMRTAADGLTAGEGEELISQAGFQDFLWYEVPRKHPAESWRPVREAAGLLLALLGLDRYAAIARSPTTEAVLDAWERSPAEGFARSRAARSASGVEPPDTNLLAWGEVIGMEEAVARQAVERALEQAITAGDLRPGKGGWRLVAAEVCTRTLLARAGDGSDGTILQAALDERVDAWVNLARPPALKAWRERLRAWSWPDVGPSDVAAAVAPMRWLLDACAEGAALTQAGYLPPAMAREAADRFGWWEWPGQPRSEADVHQLGVLRQTAARLHLVSKRSRRLAVTRRGSALADDAVGLWQAIAATLACEDGYLAMLSELVAHRLLEGPALDDALEQEIGPIVAAQGWTADGVLVTDHQAGLAAHRALYHWRLFGLLDEVHARWEGGRPIRQRSTALNALGRSAAIAFLRARATTPRTDLRA
jgi:hypothetical protein